MSRCVAAHREYRGWDIFHEPNHTGINWTARKDNGEKIRADTLAGLRYEIQQRG